MGFSRQESWSVLQFPPPGDLPDLRIESMSPVFPTLASGFFTTEPPGKPFSSAIANNLWGDILALGRYAVSNNFHLVAFAYLKNPSVQFSRSVVSDSLQPHESQHARPPCPSPTPGIHSDSRPSSQWCLIWANYFRYRIRIFLILSFFLRLLAEISPFPVLGTICPRQISYLPCSRPRISHFPEAPWFFLVWNLKLTSRP